MSDIPQKRCRKCGQEFPATREYFSTDKSTSDGLRSACNPCRAAFERQRKRSSPKYLELQKLKAQLKAQTISALEFSRRTGRSDDLIRKYLRRGDIPFSRVRNEPSVSYSIPEEEAREFARRMGWPYVVDGIDQLNGHLESSSLKEEVPVTRGTSDTCGSCGRSQGNILGDVNKVTGERYGYLCMKCYQLVRDFGDDPRRIQKILIYIEHTRLCPV